MSDCIGGTDSKCSVDHARQEDESSTRVACLVGPVGPHEVIRLVATASYAGHDGANDNDDEEPRDNEVRPELGYHREGTICIHDDEAACPADNEVADEHMPTLRLKSRVVQRVCVN